MKNGLLDLCSITHEKVIPVLGFEGEKTITISAWSLLVAIVPTIMIT